MVQQTTKRSATTGDVSLQVTATSPLLDQVVDSLTSAAQGLTTEEPLAQTVTSKLLHKINQTIQSVEEARGYVRAVSI